MSFFASKDFLVPFLSTLMASITILFLQFCSQYIEKNRKKLYAVAYISDISLKILISELILKKQTILPHIEAAKRILKGDKGLLEKIFLLDEFDILTDNPPDFSLLPEEYKILLGIDDIKLVQSYELVMYTNKNNTTQISFNSFVKENLKSKYLFYEKTEKVQEDVLNTYWDYLAKIQHEADRDIRFIMDVMIPCIKRYIERRKFFVFSKESVEKSLLEFQNVISTFKEVLPDKDYIKKLASGGIQKIL